MRKSTLCIWICAAAAVAFAVADIVLLCVYHGNVFGKSLAFFLCLAGFGLSVLAASIIFFLRMDMQSERRKKLCLTCGKTCKQADVFCPFCGARLDGEEN